jgi:hypothetical protein
VVVSSQSRLPAKNQTAWGVSETRHPTTSRAEGASGGSECTD